MRIERQHIHRKTRTIGLMLFAASLPFPILWSNLAIWLLILNWLLESTIAEKIKLARKRPSIVFFLALYVVYWLGMLYTDNLRQGFFELEKRLPFLVFPVVFGLATTPISRSELVAVARTVIASCGLASLICLINAVYLNYLEGHTLSYVYNAVVNDIHLPGRYYYFNYWYFTNKLLAKPIGMHPVYFSMYLIFSACLSVWLWSFSQAKRKTIRLIFYLFFISVMVVMLGSRTQLLAMFLLGLGFGVYIAYLKRWLVPMFVVVLAIASVLLAIVWFNPILKERFIESNKPGAHFSENKYGEGGLSLRLYKWKYALQVIKQHPLLGVGTGDAQDQLQKAYLANDFQIGYENNFNAHNQYLQITLALGIVGLLVFLVYMSYSLNMAFRTKSALQVFLILLFAISCITEAMLEANKGIVFLSFFNSLLAYCQREEEPLI